MSRTIDVLVPAAPNDPVLRTARWIAARNEDRLTAGGHCVRTVGGTECNEASLTTRPVAPDGVAYFGHGHPDHLPGSDERPLFGGAAANRLLGRGFYAFACCSALQLGPRLVTAGVRSFVGYGGGLTTEWSEVSIPVGVRPAFEALVTEATCALAEGIRDESALRSRVLPTVEAVTAWCDEHEEAAELRRLAEQIFRRLVVLSAPSA